MLMNVDSTIPCSSENKKNNRNEASSVQTATLINRLLKRVCNNNAVIAPPLECVELQAILAEGGNIKSEAETACRKKHQTGVSTYLPLSLKGKLGIFMGATALLAGTGLGARYFFRTERETESSSGKSANRSEMNTHNKGSQEYVDKVLKQEDFFDVVDNPDGSEKRNHIRRHILDEENISSPSKRNSLSLPKVKYYFDNAFSSNKRVKISFIYSDPQDYQSNNKSKTLVELPKPDDVKIEKIDFSCVTNRENLSWKDIFRQVGATLSNPVSMMMSELQVIHHYVYLGEGCPTAEEKKALLDITQVVDALQTQILTSLPGTNVYAMFQLLIGPAMKMFADELDNKKINSQELIGFNLQGAALDSSTYSNTFSFRAIKNLPGKKYRIEIYSAIG